MKKCNICDKKAHYKIKDLSDYYCDECAVEFFGDVGMLEKVEEEAQRLKNVIKERLENVSEADLLRTDKNVKE